MIRNKIIGGWDAEEKAGVGLIRYGAIFSVSANGERLYIELSLCEAYLCDRELQRKKINLRRRDRHYFVKKLGKEYMKDKVIHHSWLSDCINTFLLTQKEHDEIHNGGYKGFKMWQHI